MSVRLYVVTDKHNDRDFLVAAKTRNHAMNYVAKSVLQNLSANPATPLQVLLKGEQGSVVLGEAADLAAIGISGSSENQPKN